MKIRNFILGLAVSLLGTVAWAQPGSQYQQNPTAPDCQIPFTFTATGANDTTVTPGLCSTGDNRQTGVMTWTLTYASTGFSAVTITLQSAPGAGYPSGGAFVTFAGSVVTGSNPMTSTAGGAATLKNGTVAIPWVRVDATTTGSGTIVGVLQGWQSRTGGGSAVCALTGTQTTGYVLTALDNGTACDWETVGGASVDANTVKNAVYIADGGSANGITGTTTTAFPGAYAAGQAVFVKMNATNTGATTININSLGTKAATKSGATALASGNLVSGRVYLLVYDGVEFEVTNYTILAADIPTTNQNTTGTAAALAANGSNCSAGSYPLGTDAAGNAESCTAAPTIASSSGALKGDGSGGAVAVGGTGTNCVHADGTTAACPGGGGTGDVVGPSSATDNAVARFDATTGKLIQDSLVTVDDSGNISTSGGISTGVGGGLAGFDNHLAGTAHTATGVGFQAPTSITTPFLFTLPALPAAGVVHATNAVPSVMTVSPVVNADVTSIDAATKLTGATPVANGGTGTGSSLTGIVRGSASAMTAAELSGDATTSTSNVVTVVKVNGTTLGTNSAADQVPVTTAAATGAWKSLPNCGDSSHGLAYDTSTHGFSCQSITGAAGSPSFPPNAQTSTYQVLAGDFSACKVIPVASGTFTVTLVASGSQPSNGQCIWVINYGSGVVTIARSGQNINGGTASLSLAAGSATKPVGAFIVSNATDYFGQIFGAEPPSIQIGSSDTLTCSTINTTETDFATTRTIPADTLITGKAFRVSVGFESTGTAGVTFLIKMKLGSTVVLSGVAGNGPNGTAVGTGFTAVVYGTAVTGPTANVETSLVAGAGIGGFPARNATAQPVAVATNANKAVTMSLTCGGNTALHSVTLRTLMVEPISSI